MTFLFFSTTSPNSIFQKNVRKICQMKSGKKKGRDPRFGIVSLSAIYEGDRIVRTTEVFCIERKHRNITALRLTCSNSPFS